MPSGGYPEFSPDDSILIVFRKDQLHLIRTSDWKVLLNVRDEHGLLSFSFSADTEKLLIAEEGRVRRFQINPWTELPPVKSAADAEISLSEDRHWIRAVTGVAGKNRQQTNGTFWNVDSGEPVTGETIPKLDLNWIGLRPPEHYDITGASGDMSGGAWTIDKNSFNTLVLNIHETENWRLVAGLKQTSRIKSVAISRRGTWIAVKTVGTGNDDEVFIWPWTYRLSDRACELLPRNLTATEWNKYVLDLGLGTHKKTCGNLPLPKDTGLSVATEGKSGSDR